MHPSLLIAYGLLYHLNIRGPVQPDVAVKEDQVFRVGLYREDTAILPSFLRYPQRYIALICPNINHSVPKTDQMLHNLELCSLIGAAGVWLF